MRKLLYILELLMEGTGKDFNVVCCFSLASICATIQQLHPDIFRMINKTSNTLDELDSRVLTVLST